MKKITLLFAFGSLFLAGCPKHEIIPAPEAKVSLTSSFNGTINGAVVELTQNVDSYALNATDVKTIFPSPQLSTANYYAELKSSQQLVSIRIGLGSVMFDASASNGEPGLSAFNSFFTSNLTPNYALSANNGFEVVFRDGSGNVWTSKPTNPSPAQSVEFNEIVQESDSKGDYSKFKCVFSTYVYRTYEVSPGNFTTDSLLFSNSTFRGWFKR